MPFSELMNDVQAVGSVAREDMHDASLRDRVAFGVTAVGLVAHQLGMEAALFAVGTNAYLIAHDNLPAIAAPFVVGAVNGLFSLGVETSLTAGTARGFETFPNTTEEFADRFIISDEPDETVDKQMEHARKEKRNLTDIGDTALVAVTVGSAATVILDYAKHPNDPIENHRKLGMRSARALGGINAALGLVVGAGIYASEELGSDSVYNGVEAVADSPYTYGILAGLLATRALFAAVNHGKKRRERSRRNTETTPEE